MSTKQDADQVRQAYVDAMGPELGNIYFNLWNECAYLHCKWKEYRTLFGTNSERIAVLNRAAGTFFGIVQRTLWDDILLHICRLTDPPRSVGKDNLTVTRLPQMVDEKIKAEIQTLLDECIANCRFAQDRRKRRIAHSDLHLAIGHPDAAPLTPTSRKSVEKGLATVANLLNAIELHYTASTVMYNVPTIENAKSLLYVIRDGLLAEENRKKRVRSGNHEPGDISPTPL